EVLLDGEVVCLDGAARPSFHRLQQRTQLERPLDIERAALELPATYFAFDLLAVGGRDLRGLPLEARKALLRRAVPPAGPLRFADHVEARGADMLAAVKGLGLEGIVAKKAAGPYRAGRSPDWLKLKVERTGDFVVVGYSAPKRTRTGFGALHLAAFEGGRLLYCGKVGTGFSEKELAETRARLEASRCPEPPCDGEFAVSKGDVWCEPRVVVEVRFIEITEEGVLRHPAFLRFRTDKKLEECEMPRRRKPEEKPAAPAATAPATGPTPAPAARGAEPVAFAHLDKPYWPDAGSTKGDLIAYYREIAPFMLPYLKDRPAVLTRYPDGIGGKSFYQKDAPSYAPAWIRREKIWAEDTQRDIAYFVLDDANALLYVANLGSIPVHVWMSRAGAALDKPDWCLVDLDPKEAPFRDVVRVALAVRDLCEAIGLPTTIKTSGSTGLHVLIPLGQRYSYEQSRTLGNVIARVIERDLPDIATTERVIAARGKRVYLDFLQNRHGQLMAAPFSARPLPGAPVSMPLRWAEVNESLDPKKFTIRTALRRLDELGEDPLRPVLALAPDLSRALDKLAAKLK
ncbi:MAG TPA: DNA ligase D, partial [Planctomycetota bacterium]|nr:DNA ligase D [Planctomycetota bacterium]